MKNKLTLPPLHATVTVLLLLFCSALLLCRGDIAAAGVERGLSLCIETLLPALFPFLVLSELLVRRRVGDLAQRAFSRPVAALFGISGRGAAALLLGLLCGAPVGTVTATALRRQGAISKEELQRLILFVNNPSSGFLIGAVGSVMLGNTAAGVALFLITWLSALTVGCGLRLLWGKLPASTATVTDDVAPPSVRDLTDSVTRGFDALLRIFAFVLFFSCISACLGTVLTALGLSERAATALCGLLEMTAGISEAAARFSPVGAFRLIAFLSGFSGLSVCLQVFSITEGEELRIAPYLLARLCQGGVALLLSELYLRMFRPVLTVSDSIATFAVNPVGQRHLLGVLLIFSLLLCLALWQTKKRRKAPPLK